MHWLPAAKMINTIHDIHGKYGLLLGPTAGSAYAVADWIARKNPDKVVLSIFPDSGIRYLDTVFNPEWLDHHKEELKRDWSEPVAVTSPKEVGKNWQYLQWGRRSYQQAMGHGPVSRQAKNN